jgi:hypothetical protein
MTQCSSMLSQLSLCHLCLPSHLGDVPVLYTQHNLLTGYGPVSSLPHHHCVPLTLRINMASDSDHTEMGRISLCTKPLNSSNFSEWKGRISDALMEKYLWEYVNGECTKPTAARPEAPTDQEQKTITDWRRKDNAAAAFIRRHVEQEQLHHVSEGSGAHATWTALCKAHEKQTMQAIALIVHRIVTAQYVENTKMEDHINVLRTNNKKLVAQNTTVHFSDPLLALLLLKSLPPSFTPVVQTLGALSPDQFTFAHVSATLLDEERRRQAATVQQRKCW